MCAGGTNTIAYRAVVIHARLKSFIILAPEEKIHKMKMELWVSEISFAY